MNPYIANIFAHPKSTAIGALTMVAAVVNVLDKFGITLGHAGTGTVTTIVLAIAGALLTVCKDPTSNN